MKKLLSFLLLFLFLFTNSGMSLTIHWCGGKYSSYSLLPSKKHTCKCGKKPMKAGCCKNTSKLLKSNTELIKLNSIVFKSDAKNTIADINDFRVTNLKLKFHDCFLNFYHPPPFKPKVPIYVWNNVFII